jgi:hypothetical protein
MLHEGLGAINISGKQKVEECCSSTRFWLGAIDAQVFLQGCGHVVTIVRLRKTLEVHVR